MPDFNAWQEQGKIVGCTSLQSALKATLALAFQCVAIARINPSDLEAGYIVTHGHAFVPCM